MLTLRPLYHARLRRGWLRRRGPKKAEEGGYSNRQTQRHLDVGGQGKRGFQSERVKAATALPAAAGEVAGGDTRVCVVLSDLRVDRSGRM